MKDVRPDFSERATKKAVLNETLQNPITLVGVASGILGGLATVLFDGGIIVSSLAIGGAALSVFSWLVNYFGRNQILADRHIKKLHEEFDKRKQAALKQIQLDLDALVSIPGAKHLAEQGSEQFQKSEEKYLNLESMLKQKFDETEITYGKYVGTAEQVYLQILDNLLDVTNTLRAIKTIDIEYINKRMKALDQLEELDEADLKERETLNSRLILRDTQIDKVNMLLTRNEEAMTALDHTAAAISGTKTLKGRASTDFQSAMEELQRLASQVERYAK